MIISIIIYIFNHGTHDVIIFQKKFLIENNSAYINYIKYIKKHDSFLLNFRLKNT